MLLFNLIMLNSIWRKRYLKLDNKTQDDFMNGIVLFEWFILWTIAIYLIIRG